MNKNKKNIIFSNIYKKKNNMLFILFFGNIYQEKPYQPDIKVGIIKKSNECKRIVTTTSIVFCHIKAKVEGQSLNIIDTYINGNPIRIKMNSPKIITGFVKGLESSCLGEIRKILIPPGLSYGEQFIDGLFPPDSTWIVEVEIIDIIEGESV